MFGVRVVVGIFFQYLAPWQSMLDLTKTKEADCTKVENTVKGQEKKDASLMTGYMISHFTAQQKFGQDFI